MKLKISALMVMALAFSTLGYAEGTSTSMAGGSATSIAGSSLGMGTVISVDTSLSQVVVDMNGSQQTITVADSASLQELKPGDKVQADTSAGTVQKQQI